MQVLNHQNTNTIYFLQDVRMNTSGAAADLSEQMMEWNTPIAVVEAVVAGKRASWAAMLEKEGAVFM